MYYDAISLSGGGHACTCDVDPSCCDQPGGLSGLMANPLSLGQANPEKLSDNQIRGISVVGLLATFLLARAIWAAP